MLRRCANAECGREFETRNLRRVFCCERCRRTGQNASRRSARAEARQARERTRPMADPWAQLPADEWEVETVWANALLDAVPAGLAENPTRGGDCFGAFFSCAEPPAAALFVDAASDADFSGAEPSASDVAVPDAAASAVSGGRFPAGCSEKGGASRGVFAGGSGFGGWAGRGLVFGGGAGNSGGPVGGRRSGPGGGKDFGGKSVGGGGGLRGADDVAQVRRSRASARRRKIFGFRRVHGSRRVCALRKAGAEGSAFTFGIASVIAGFGIADGVFHTGLGATGGFPYPRASGRNGQRGQHDRCKNTLKGSHDFCLALLLTLRSGRPAGRGRKERMIGRFTLNA